MFLINFFYKLVCYIFSIPKFLYYYINDFIKYVKNKGWRVFDKWGIHIYLGAFGECKTSSAVNDTYLLCKRYKQLQVITNIKLSNFPLWTVIKPLNTVLDIMQADDNTIILIDEIGTIFNSRDFKAGNSLPKILLQYICQVRHRHIVILGTAQDWEDIDVQIRRKTSTVRLCKAHLKHPFTRYQTYTIYNAKQYSNALNNVNYPLQAIGTNITIQTDKIRQLYDTKEMVATLFNMQYDTDTQIQQTQTPTNNPQTYDEINHKAKHNIRKRATIC